MSCRGGVWGGGECEKEVEEVDGLCMTIIHLV